MRFRAVLFDVGETLVHPEPSFPELFARIVGEAGHERDPEAVVAASAMVRRRFSEASRDGDLWTRSPEASRGFWLDVYGRMLSELALPNRDGLRERLFEGFTDLGNYALFDDVPAALDALDAGGLILGIVSNYEAWLDDLLFRLGVRDRFPVRVISGLEGIEKPDPRIYGLALRRSGVPAPEVAFVGDNPEFDVDPPAALGMFPVLIDRRDRYPEHEGTRIADLRDLADLLEAA
ncbi:MAG TPA: HAD-IA family hydrolase [Actinomycetota bacterium]|nr:HAD-IA family hydrolase [Actinomycetota bacterium]